MRTIKVQKFYNSEPRKTTISIHNADGGGYVWVVFGGFLMHHVGITIKQGLFNKQICFHFYQYFGPIYKRRIQQVILSIVYRYIQYDVFVILLHKKDDIL